MTIEEFYDAVDVLSEAWEQLLHTVEETANAIREIFERFQEEERERQKVESTPCKYGMSLIKVYGQPILNYNYRPVGRKNLPYQRRIF